MTNLARRPQQWLRATQVPCKPLVSNTLTCGVSISRPTSMTRVGKLVVASSGQEELCSLKQLLIHCVANLKQGSEFAVNCALLPLTTFVIAGTESVRTSQSLLFFIYPLSIPNVKSFLKPSSAAMPRTALHLDFFP